MTDLDSKIVKVKTLVERGATEGEREAAKGKLKILERKRNNAAYKKEKLEKEREQEEKLRRRKKNISILEFIAKEMGLGIEEWRGARKKAILLNRQESKALSKLEKADLTILDITDKKAAEFDLEGFEWLLFTI